MSEQADEVVSLARAFKRGTGQPLIVHPGLAGRMRQAGVDVAALEAEGSVMVSRPIPLQGERFWTRRRLRNK